MMPICGCSALLRRGGIILLLLALLEFFISFDDVLYESVSDNIQF